MIEPTEDEVLVKAKQLTHDEGSLWLWNEEEDNREPNARDRVVDDSFRASAGIGVAREDLNRWRPVRA
jgi:hypothetical protein